MSLQGMNFVAGCLLLFMEEEDAFWCLAVIVEQLLPGYFDTTMAASQVHESSIEDDQIGLHAFLALLTSW